MSKLKSDIIERIYKENYRCKNDHNVEWSGSKYVFSNNLSCDKCGKSSQLSNPIRWFCPQCKTYFCSLCYIIIADKLCPKKHKYKFIKQSSADLSANFTCDKCYKSLKTMDGVLYDNECNVTLCPNCFYDSCDVPDVLDY